MILGVPILSKELESSLLVPGLEKLLVLPVPDQFFKLKTDLFLDKKLKNHP